MAEGSGRKRGISPARKAKSAARMAAKVTSKNRIARMLRAGNRNAEARIADAMNWVRANEPGLIQWARAMSADYEAAENIRAKLRKNREGRKFAKWVDDSGLKEALS